MLNNPERKLPDEQRKIFNDNGWKIIEAANPAHNTPPPLCYSSVWLSMNVLMIDPKTVCVESSEVYQMDQLDKFAVFGSTLSTQKMIFQAMANGESRRTYSTTAMTASGGCASPHSRARRSASARWSTEQLTEELKWPEH